MYNVVQSHMENLYVDIIILRLRGLGGKLCLRLGEESFFLWFWLVGEQAPGGGGRWGEGFGSSPS